MRPDQPERQLREPLDALGPAPRAELLRVLVLPTSSGPTGSASSGEPEDADVRRAADREEDRTLQAVLVGMLREAERNRKG